MANVSPRSTPFTDRIKPRHSQASEPAQSVKVVEAENDFPFAAIDHLRVGSAHAACEPTQDAEHIDLMLRISTHIMSRYEPNMLPAQVSVEFKSGTCTDDNDPTHTSATVSPLSASDHFEPSFLDRRWLKGLYLCVLVQGQQTTGTRAYCYFGVFADALLDFVDRHQPNQPNQPNQPFNPSQLKAIVLSRSNGEPTAEIREFMRMKFSFDYKVTILELSRSA